MRHTFTLRLRLPRSAARLTLLWVLLAWPAAVVCPVTQTSTLVGYVPDGPSTPVAYTTLTTNQKAVLGKVANSSIYLVQQNCSQQNPPPKPQYRTTTDLKAAMTPSSCNTSLRRIHVYSNATGQSAETGSSSDPDRLRVSGDIRVDKLCFWNNTDCSTFWPMEFGQFSLCGNANATNCTVNYTSAQGFVEARLHWSVQGATVPTPSGNAWTGGTPYTVGQYVTFSGGVYQCTSNHTAVEFNADKEAGRWRSASIAFPFNYAHKIKYTPPNPDWVAVIPNPSLKDSPASVCSITGSQGGGYCDMGKPGGVAGIAWIRCRISYPATLPTEAVGDCDFRFSDPGTSKTFKFAPSATCSPTGSQPCPKVSISG